MYRSLFQETGRFYKANLHNHTTFSDGSDTPEEIKRIYQAGGYDIVAFTDHNVIVPHAELSDEHFLALTGTEYDFNAVDRDRPYSFWKTYHMLLIVPCEDPECYPYANPDYVWGDARKHIQPYFQGDAPHDYSIRSVNQMIREAHKMGFLTVYCHPAWSLQRYPDYCRMKDVDFIEVSNSSCVTEGFLLDHNDHVFSDFLSLGQFPAPLSTDDGHSMRNYCGGWTMVKSDALNYGSVFDSLKRKEVYASFGPEITDICYDPDRMRLLVLSKDAVSVYLSTERRYAEVLHRAPEWKSGFFEFDLSAYISDTLEYSTDSIPFVRVTLVDQQGRKAFSRAYRVSELLQ
ncbi:MAG: PHP domain-containing protein [Lachnospiraceae bacterium]|nr:PHP domain-containing protein [Lachnospiraceae bacterium]